MKVFTKALVEEGSIIICNNIIMQVKIKKRKEVCCPSRPTWAFLVGFCHVLYLLIFVCAFLCACTCLILPESFKLLCLIR